MIFIGLFFTFLLNFNSFLMQHQTMESYIEDKKNLYTLIHEFLEESDESSEKSFQKL